MFTMTTRSPFRLQKDPAKLFAGAFQPEGSAGAGAPGNSGSLCERRLAHNTRCQSLASRRKAQMARPDSEDRANDHSTRSRRPNYKSGDLHTAYLAEKGKTGRVTFEG